MIHNILSALNESNSTNHKLATLKKYKNNELLKRILKMTYDNVEFTYGVTVPQVEKFASSSTTNTTNTLTPGTTSLECALDVLEEQLSTRAVTGHAALQVVSELLATTDPQDAALLKKIINRDLRVNFGKTLIVKVWPGLIKKPVYMRCDVYGPKTSKNIKFPAYVQLKADGLACFTHVTPNEVICYTRSGETFKLNSIQYLSNKRELHNKIIQGELLIEGELDRAISNGEINSLIKFRQGNNSSISDNDADIIESRLLYQVWDIITESEWLNAQNKIKCNIPYKERFEEILGIDWTNEHI